MKKTRSQTSSMMPRSIGFTVPGVCQPAGSKRFVGVKGGRGIVLDANKNAAGWKERVALAAAEAKQKAGYREPWAGPLHLIVHVQRARPRGHFTSKGAVRATAPAFPVTKPDLTKLIRGIEDALTGIIWIDDSQVVSQTAIKYWHDEPGVRVWVRDYGEANNS